ncbi:MAG: Gfo/Idh/MocA family protein [Candidatus Brocadiia bacterium]
MVELALIGTGNWGKNLLRNYAQLPGARLKYCCDLDEARLQAFREQYPETRFTTDVDALLGDPQVEAVVIAAPAPQHHPLGLRALQAGKHTYIEKPLALSTRQAGELVAEAEQRDLRLMVGHLLLYHPAVTRLKEVVDSGELGDILYIYCQRVNLGVIRRDENALWSLAPHDISVALYLLGDQPADVSARGSCYLQRDAGVEDCVFANVSFPGGRMVHLHVSWLDPHKIRRITVVGSRKMAVFDDVESTEKLRVYDKGVQGGVSYESYGDLLTLRYGDIHIPHVPMTEPLRIECEHFVRCVDQGREPLTDGRNGLAVVQVLEAAQKSLQQGGVPVSLPSQ